MEYIESVIKRKLSMASFDDLLRIYEIKFRFPSANTKLILSFSKKSNRKLLTQEGEG